jgi:two-component system CheB/CheR fusion protein
MQILNIAEMETYINLLRTQPAEVHSLFNDFLITVTNFFRNPESFEVLEQVVIPKLFLNKTPEDQVRVWVVGCATGEEAYSIAMLLKEYARHLDAPPSLQVFASDLSENALRKAREGFYAEVMATDVSAERLQCFFTKEPGGYRVRKELREIVLFAPHNLLKDPPFSRLRRPSARSMSSFTMCCVPMATFSWAPPKHLTARNSSAQSTASRASISDNPLYIGHPPLSCPRDQVGIAYPLCQHLLSV